jgi:antitoxin YefM
MSCEEVDKMRAVAIADAKRNMDDLVKRIIDDSEPAIVLTESGDQVVMMPLDDFNAWAETHYLLSNPANAAHLARSIAEAKAGLATPRDLIEP